MEKSVSTVTVNYNHKHFPKLCVEAVEASQADFLIQIIFVDNASSDPISVNFLKQAATESRINLVESKMNVGFAGGNNLGAKVATGK
ncbi:glycosyltransferase family 2 protein, partial [Candidatus Peregrinibacteria bacterium CG_4_9_14_0_2_um_filter_41_14]